MILELDKKRGIILGGLFLRIIVLILISLLIGTFPRYGFMSDSPINDDYRYERGAELYSGEAHSIIDTSTFTRIYDNWGDWTGHQLNKPIRWGWLWYWICCILVYITKTRWSIRILNILFSVATIKYIYEVTYDSYSEKSATIAAGLWAFLPYPVIFSCFAYKDSLVAFCLIYLVSRFVIAKKMGGFSPKLIIGILLVSLIFIMTRSGISELFICVCLLYYFSDKIHLKIRARYLFLISLAIIVVAYVLWKNYGIIIGKYQAYVTPTAVENTGLGTLVKVTGLKDIWKLPLAYVFAILQPIGLDFSNMSWYTILCAANFVMCPISIAAVFGLKKSLEQNKSLFWLLLIYYLIVISSSILIFRHLFHALPITIIFASNYLAGITNETALPFGLISVLLLVCMLVVFI